VWSEWSQLFTQDASFLEGKEPFVLDVGVAEPLGQFLPQNRLFVRKCYSDLFSFVWDMFKKDCRETVTLTGTPGIGKSVFGLLFLIELVRFLRASAASPEKIVDFGLGLNGQIVYEHAKGVESNSTFFLIDTNKNTISFSHDAPLAWLSNPHTFLIKDGPCKDYVVNCSVLWLSSPRAGSFQKAGDNAKGSFILPPWETDELVECWRQGCAPKELFTINNQKSNKAALEAAAEALSALDEGADENAKHEATLRRWIADLGPVARRVFNPAKAYGKLADAEKDLGDKDLDSLSEFVQGKDTGGGSSKFQQSHRLLLMLPGEDFTTYEFIPSSVKIGRKILRKALETDLSRARKLMGTMTGCNLGLVFEPYAHFILSQGEEFTIRNLDNNTTEQFKTTKSETFNVSNAQLYAGDFTLKPNTYYAPTDPTFAVIDSWTDKVMFQMYAGNQSKHAMKSGSKQFMALKGKGPDRIIFVMPKGRADNFAKQPLVDTKGKKPVGENGPRGGWNDVKQYVLAL
jgi:hypothetical protein